MQHLEMINISKSFQGVVANRDVSLHIRSGEVLGLLGENGAGKTTLMNILYGLYRPDVGEIRIDGRPVAIRSPQESIRMGIGMVHQHFMLVQNHTVMENIVLGCEKAPLFFPQSRLRAAVAAFTEKFNFRIDPLRPVWQLSAGEQQRVEIIKALFYGADLLILDEPTSVLTPQEIRDLFAILRDMRKSGHLVILISHKLDEIMEICDRVTVLSKGAVVGNADTRNMDKRSLARMMIGRDVIFSLHRDRIPPGGEVLRVDSVTVQGDKGLAVVKDLSFTVNENEIFGIAGVSGNGQRELVEAITGLRKTVSGTISVKGRPIANRSPRWVYDRGVSHVPEERIKFGIAPGLCLYENAVLKQHHLKPFSNRVFLAYANIRRHARDLVRSFQVSTPSIHVQTKNLSGGNIQKLILGREISRRPPLLVASHPTYGLDVGATEYLRARLLEHRKAGRAVLLVSEDLDEIFELCDRIAVMFRGRFMGVLDAEDPRLADIGMMMAGSVRWDREETADAQH